MPESGESLALSDCLRLQGAVTQLGKLTVVECCQKATDIDITCQLNDTAGLKYWRLETVLVGGFTRSNIMELSWSWELSGFTADVILTISSTSASVISCWGARSEHSVRTPATSIPALVES